MRAITKVHLRHVTKLFGEVLAVRDVSLEITPGEVVAVMGANGAGKSTLLRIVSLLARPTRGELRFNDAAAGEDREALRRRIGLLSHDPLVYPDLTARENLRFFARLGGAADPGRRVDTLIEQFELREFADTRTTRVLSRGQLQRVSLARALVAEPDLLLLDEPAAGLDRRAIRRIEGAVDDLKARGGMALVVTHEPALAAAVATRAVMMKRGRVVLDAAAPAGLDGWGDAYLEAIGGGDR